MGRKMIEIIIRDTDYPTYFYRIDGLDEEKGFEEVLWLEKLDLSKSPEDPGYYTEDYTAFYHKNEVLFKLHDAIAAALRPALPDLSEFNGVTYEDDYDEQHFY